MSHLRTTLEVHPRHTQALAGGSAILPASALAASSLPMQGQLPRYSVYMQGEFMKSQMYWHTAGSLKQAASFAHMTLVQSGD